MFIHHLLVGPSVQDFQVSRRHHGLPSLVRERLAGRGQDLWAGRVPWPSVGGVGGLVLGVRRSGVGHLFNENQLLGELGGQIWAKWIGGNPPNISQHIVVGCGKTAKANGPVGVSGIAGLRRLIRCHPCFFCWGRSPKDQTNHSQLLQFVWDFWESLEVAFSLRPVVTLNHGDQVQSLSRTRSLCFECSVQGTASPAASYCAWWACQHGGNPTSPRC